MVVHHLSRTMVFGLKTILTFVAVVPAVIAAPAVNSHASKGETYDYVIVGGGLTGLVVANRLSEDKSRKFRTS